MDLTLFGEEEEKKVPTIEELTSQFEQYKKEKEVETASLKKQLDEEKRKNLSVLGLTRKVGTRQEEDEEVSFDFDI